MAKFQVTDPNSGRTIELESADNTPPTEQELDQVFSSMQPSESSSFSEAKFQEAPVVASQSQTPDSMSTQGLGYLKEHPFLSIFQGLPQTITGKSIEDRAVQNINSPSFGQSDSAPFNKNIPNAGNIALAQVIGGQALDMATSPATYLAGPILKGTGQVLGKSAKYVGDILNKAKASYITDEVAPKAFNVFKSNVDNFTPEIENYAKADLAVPEEAIKTIKGAGVKDIDAVSAQYGKSTDPIYQKIQQGIEKKSKEVEDAYAKAFDNFGKGGVIHVDKTKSSMGKMLREYGYIDARNKETSMALNDTIENSPLKRILNFYKALDPNKPEGVTALNSSQWNLFRNNLSKLSRQDKSLSNNITGILDSLHADAEKSGLKGISSARNLARANFQAEENILSSSLIKERKLDNFFKLAEAEKRQLKSIEDFTGTKFIDDLKKITSGKYLDNIREGKTLDSFVNDLNAAKDRAKTNYILQKYSKILGKDNARTIFKEVIANRQLGVAKKVAGWGAGLTATEELGRRTLPF